VAFSFSSVTKAAGDYMTVIVTLLFETAHCEFSAVCVSF